MTSFFRHRKLKGRIGHRVAGNNSPTKKFFGNLLVGDRATRRIIITSAKSSIQSLELKPCNDHTITRVLPIQRNFRKWRSVDRLIISQSSTSVDRLLKARRCTSEIISLAWTQRALSRNRFLVFSLPLKLSLRHICLPTQILVQPTILQHLFSPSHSPNLLMAASLSVRGHKRICQVPRPKP